MELASVVIVPPGKWTPLDLRSVLGARELVSTFAVRELKLRYRQTILGVVWIVLGPLLAALIFSFVFSSIAHLKSGGQPYFVVAFAGMVAWTAFSGIVTRLSQAMITNSAMITKIYFERLTLAAGTALASVVDVVVGLVVLTAVMALFNRAPSGLFAVGVVFVLLLALMASGLGMAAGALMVRYRDLGPIVALGIQLLLYLSPVAYTAANVPLRIRPYFELNPLAGLITSFRWAWLGTEPPPALTLLYAVVSSLVIFLGGTLVFRRQEVLFADVI